MSIHGKGLEESGLLVTAVCTNCHTAHTPLPKTDPLFSVHHEQVAAASDTRSAWCHDCHGDHRIQPMSSKDSVMSPINQIHVCERCHATEALYESEGIAKRHLLGRY